MGVTTVTRNYQVTLPKDVRKKEDIHIGDSLFVSVKDEVIELRKLSKQKLMSCFGVWKKIKEDSRKFVRKIREGSEKRLKRFNL